MFCWACGSEISEGLRFCNRCGASLTAERQARPWHLALIIILSLAVAAVTIVGLLFILIMGTEMMGRRDSTAETYVFLAVLFLMVLGADALMVRQLSRLLTAYLEPGDAQNPRRTKDRGILKAPAAELAPLTAAETTALHTTGRDTHEANEQELPTRKL